MGAQCRGKQSVYSFRRLSRPEQDRRLYYDRFRQHRRRRGVSGHIQFQSDQRAARRRRVLCAGFSVRHTHTDTNSYAQSDPDAYFYADSYATTNPNAAQHSDSKSSSDSAAETMNAKTETATRPPHRRPTHCVKSSACLRLAAPSFYQAGRMHYLNCATELPVIGEM